MQRRIIPTISLFWSAEQPGGSIDEGRPKVKEERPQEIQKNLTREDVARSLAKNRQETRWARSESIARYRWERDSMNSPVWQDSMSTGVLPDRAQELQKKFDTTKSELLTNIYTKLIKHFEDKKYGEDLPVQLAGGFMKQYGARIQVAINTYTDPSSLKREVLMYAKNYTNEVSKQGAEVILIALASGVNLTKEISQKPTVTRDTSSVDTSKGINTYTPAPLETPLVSGSLPTEVSSLPQVPGDAITQGAGISSGKDVLYPEEDEDIFEDDSTLSKSFDQYAEGVEESAAFQSEYGFHPSEYRVDEDSQVGKNEETAHYFAQHDLPPEQFQIRDGVITEPEEVFAGLHPGETRDIILGYDGGVSEGKCIALENGDYIIRLADGIDCYIDSNGDPKKAEKEFSFISAISGTPIVRRLLLTSDGAFRNFRKVVEQKYGGTATDIYTNPDTFTKYVLWMIMEKSPEPKEIWESIKSRIESQDMQGAKVILRNRRSEILKELRNKEIVAKDARGRLNLRELS